MRPFVFARQHPLTTYLLLVLVRQRAPRLQQLLVR